MHAQRASAVAGVLLCSFSGICMRLLSECRYQIAGGYHRASLLVVENGEYLYQRMVVSFSVSEPQEYRYSDRGQMRMECRVIAFPQ